MVRGVMGKNKLVLAAAAYGIIAIATFGHATESSYRLKKEERIECQNNNGRICFDGSGIAPLAGLLGGALWPLYWSWEVQSQ